MATFTITLGSFVNSYTADNADVQRILDVYNPGGTMTNAEVARLISDSWIESLTNQVRNIEIEAQKADVEAGYVPITIPHN